MTKNYCEICGQPIDSKRSKTCKEISCITVYKEIKAGRKADMFIMYKNDDGSTSKVLVFDGKTQLTT